MCGGRCPEPLSFCVLQSSITSLPDFWKMDRARRQLRYTGKGRKEAPLERGGWSPIYQGVLGRCFGDPYVFVSAGLDQRSGEEGGEEGVWRLLGEGGIPGDGGWRWIRATPSYVIPAPLF